MDKRRHKWHTENIHNTSLEINMLRQINYAEKRVLINCNDNEAVSAQLSEVPVVRVRVTVRVRHFDPRTSGPLDN